MEHFTTLLGELRARVRELEQALGHQRQLTANAEARARALEATQGLAWRAVLHGRPADDAETTTPPQSR